MTNDEWLAVLASKPATPDQVGAIMAEFGRLGFGEGDRGERLAVCAALLGVAELGSTRDLTMGAAGQLVRMLRDCPGRGALPGVRAAGDPGQAAGPGRGVMLAQAMLAFAEAVSTWRRWTEAHSRR